MLRLIVSLDEYGYVIGAEVKTELEADVAKAALAALLPAMVGSPTSRNAGGAPLSDHFAFSISHEPGTSTFEICSLQGGGRVELPVAQFATLRALLGPMEAAHG